MTKRLLSMLLCMALLLSCVSGIALFTAAEELPAPFGTFDFAGEDGKTRVSTGVVRYINAGSEKNDNIAGGTAIGETGAYGRGAAADKDGLYWGGVILSAVPENTAVTFAIEYYIDSEATLSGTLLEITDNINGTLQYSNLPVKTQGVVYYSISKTAVDNKRNADMRLRVRIRGEAVGKLYIKSAKILDSAVLGVEANPAYAYYDYSACAYYPDAVVRSAQRMNVLDSETHANHPDRPWLYRYVKLADNMLATDRTKNSPIYIRAYAAEGYENASVPINAYEYSNGTTSGFSGDMGAKGYSINFVDGVGEVYIPEACLGNHLNSASSLRFWWSDAEKIARLEVYNVATYCSEANATAEMKAKLHANMLSTMTNIVRDGYVAPTPDAPGQTGTILCAACNEKLAENSELPTLTAYAKLDFSTGELVGTAASASGFTIEQIPGTEYYGVKMYKQNQKFSFSLTDAFNVPLSEIENGTDLAITYEYYATTEWRNDSRLALVNHGYTLGINGGGVNSVWDCLPVNAGKPLTRGATNIITFTVGAGSSYTAAYDGNNLNNSAVVAGESYSTLSQAKALAEGKNFELLCWNNDADGALNRSLYLKSITIFRASDLQSGPAAADHYYIDFEGTSVAHPYYPEYTEKSNYGISATENRVEWYKEDTAQQYPRFHYMYVKVPADLLSNTGTKVTTPVKLVIERKEGSTANDMTFQYQDDYSGDARWSASQTVTFDENGRYEIDLLDARFFNGLNENSSIRLRSVYYEQKGDAENGYTYEAKDTDNLEDIAFIRMYDLREVCEEYHDKFTEANGNLKREGRVESTFEEEGFSGNLVCVHCGEVVQAGEALPLQKEYAKFDFSNGTADLTSVTTWSAIGATSLVPVQIPGTESYGLKFNVHNAGLQFKLDGFAGITAEDIANGKEVAVSVEYYVPGNVANTARFVFDGENGANKIMALYTNYGGTTWDAAVLNPASAMTRNQLNVVTFKLGANVDYVTGPGQFSAANKFTEPQTVNTLELAQDLVSGGNVILRAWNVQAAVEDDPTTDANEAKAEQAIYIKSITIYDAKDTNIKEVDTTVEFIDYTSVNAESPKYYPEYVTYGGGYGISALQVTEEQKDEGDVTYVYYSVTASKKPAGKDVQPVVIRITLKEGSELAEVKFAYQTAAPWTYITLDVNDGVAQAVLDDAAFTNGLNGKGSLRFGNGAYNGKTVDEIAKIEVYAVRDNTALVEALDRAAELMQHKTPASVEAYMAVVNAAQAVADDPWVTEEDIAAAIEQLTAAEELLKDCDHSCGTELVNYVAETCLTVGYSGDKACVDCGYIADEDYGTEIPMHETRLINVKETSCGEAGYTGDLWCDHCQAVARAGKEIGKLPHTFDEGVVTKNPTAQEYGEITRTCTGCGATTTVRLEFEAQIGDVNGDGNVDSTDARLVLQFAVKKISPTDLDISVSDVNGDERTDSTDARLILQLAVGKITEFPNA